MEYRRKGRTALANRVREIRRELYGEDGGQALAVALRVPYRTWRCFEAGDTLPAEILLGFVELTGVDPTWLLMGEGPKFSRRASTGRIAKGSGR